ncbi:ABC transporter ATP-binding protein [Nonomuraea rhodomycinica]|uniref:ABC transporter ATP-binding protein n=1 Tax=Nonomuraea rhodomycinica TaxID=1712872 RepID=A0A7Y6IS05_9ACTN|nr:ABC transporter ATP-binding protein [Nonomuraea rhodomycinica]NUW43361.1 ABC transporter ATP-binding protein [Nonomuraea rhodomycinica]
MQPEAAEELSGLPRATTQDEGAPALPRTGLGASLAEIVRISAQAAPGMMTVHAFVVVVQGLAPVASAWAMKLLVDGIPDPAVAPAALAWRVGLFGALAVATAGLPHLSQYLGDCLGRAFAVRAAADLFSATLRFAGLARFEDPGVLDRLRLGQQAADAGQTLVTGGFMAVQSMISLIGFAAALWVVSPVMTLVAAVAAVPGLVVQVRLSRRRNAMMMHMSPHERRQIFYGGLLADGQAAKEIRLFGIGGWLRDRLLGELTLVNEERRRMDGRELRAEGLLGALGAVVSAGGLAWATFAARAGALSVGDVSMFAVAVASTFGGAATLISTASRVYSGLLMFGHHVAIVRAAPDLPVPAVPTPVRPLAGGLELHDVWFRYSPDHPWILRGVSLRIPHGATVGVVGANGAGKSTLVKLLLRFYDPQQGSITWDGVDLRDMDPAALRERISGVFQDHMTYDLTARENVGLGSLDALQDLDRIRVAARRAGIDDVLSALPRGYETQLSRMFTSEADKEDPETGVVLSGGQWQRTALARAFLRADRDLMILDEPSSGLDPESEADVHSRMRAHRAGRTSLLISHRLNTVRDADLIVVLRDGVVAEQGTHDQLMAAGGTYAHLFRLQSAGYTDAAGGAALTVEGSR